MIKLIFCETKNSKIYIYINIIVGNRKIKSRLTSDLLDMPQESYLKEWKSNDTIPLAVTNRWELLTYHLNSIAKANRGYEHHSNSYWNNKRQKMRNDKDFIIGLNV